MDYEFLHSSENVNIARERSVKSVKMMKCRKELQCEEESREGTFKEMQNVRALKANRIAV
jgi:hypothetical protein